jgi:hypothetical protein
MIGKIRRESGMENNLMFTAGHLDIDHGPIAALAIFGAESALGKHGVDAWWNPAGIFDFCEKTRREKTANARYISAKVAAWNRLQNVPALITRETVDCGGRKQYALCPGGDAIAEIYGGCGHANCVRPECKAEFTAQRAKRARKAFEAIRFEHGFDVLTGVVFTVPVHYREFVRSSAKIFRRLAWKVLASHLMKYTKLSKSTLGGYAVVHPDGDRTEKHCHVHVVIANITDWIPQLPQLKKAWKQALMMQWGLLIEGKINIHVEHGKTPEKAGFMLRYTFRHWPSYSAWVTRCQPYGILGPRSEFHIDERPMDTAELMTGKSCQCGHDLKLFIPLVADGNQLFFGSNPVGYIREGVERYRSVNRNFVIWSLSERERLRIKPFVSSWADVMNAVRKKKDID